MNKKLIPKGLYGLVPKVIRSVVNVGNRGKNILPALLSNGAHFLQNGLSSPRIFNSVLHSNYLNPDGIDLGELMHPDPLQKGLEERKIFLSWLDLNPEVTPKKIPLGWGPARMISNWADHPGFILLTSVLPNGRAGKFLTYLSNRFNVLPQWTVDIGSSNNFDEYTGGVFDPNDGTVRVSVDDPETFVSRIAHESGGHSTEEQVFNNPISLYTSQKPPKFSGFSGFIDFMRSSPTELFGRRLKTVRDVYERLGGIQHSIFTLPEFYRKYHRIKFPVNSKNSKLPDEARATLKELLESILNQVGYDPQKYNNYIDQLSAEDLIQRLGNLNAYGADYSNNFKYATAKDQRQWVELAKFALKHLPSVSIPIAIGATTNSEENENTPDEN